MTAREIPDAVLAKMHSVLDAREGELRTALRTMLLEQSFPPHPRFRKTGGPPLDEADRLVGVCFEYDFGVYVPVAHGLSRASACKCGIRWMIKFPEGALFEDADEMYAASRPDDVEAQKQYALSDVQSEILEEWLCRMWRRERAAAPELRGFATIHESSRWRDLDSGEFVDAKLLGLGAL